MISHSHWQTLNMKLAPRRTTQSLQQAGPSPAEGKLPMPSIQPTTKVENGSRYDVSIVVAIIVCRIAEKVQRGRSNDCGRNMGQNLEKGPANLSHHQLIRPQWPLTLHKSHLPNHTRKRRMTKTIAKLMLWSLSPHHSDQRCLLHPWQRYLPLCHNNMPSL